MPPCDPFKARNRLLVAPATLDGEFLPYSPRPVSDESCSISQRTSRRRVGRLWRLHGHDLAKEIVERVLHRTYEFAGALRDF